VGGDDPRVLADVGPVPAGEAIVEIPEDVLKFYARSYETGLEIQGGER
jgi:hypothetical protein